MKKLLIVLIALMLSCTSQQHLRTSRSVQTHTIQVKISKNVELLGFTYFLGYQGNYLDTHDENLKIKPIKKRDWYAYGYHVYQQYKAHTGSKNLAVAVSFMENIWLDYLVALLIQLEDFPKATLPTSVPEKYYINFSPTKNPAEARQHATQFIQALNQLYREVNFDEYLKQNEQKYSHARRQVTERLPEQNFVPAIEAFYRSSFDKYVLVPSLLIPTGMAFGNNFTQRGKSTVYHVFGPLDLQQFAHNAQLNMGFTDEKRLHELSVHEFGHSFVNPAVDKVPQELIVETEKLFIPIKNAMSDQGYTRWKSCLYEHFVRAGEVLIAEQMGKKEDAEKLKKHYIETRKFIYLPVILEELTRYQQDKADTYAKTVQRALEKMKAIAYAP